MGIIPVVNGIVLSAMPVGEYDKRLSILTKERGKITAFARGARKPKSPYIAAANPFATGSFEIYEGKNSYTLGKADIKEYFGDLQKDLKKAYYGLYFCEVADYFSREAPDEDERITLLFKALKALEKETLSVEHIRAVYEFKTMVINGEYPDVFSMDESAMPKSVLYAFQFIALKNAKEAFTFTLAEDLESGFTDIVGKYKREFFSHNFKSEEFLNLV